jgi:hypothetical protein
MVLNQTILGKNSGILGNLTIENQGTNVVSDISVDFNISGPFAEFTGTYPTHQEIASLSQGNSENLAIELGTNLTESVPGAADVCLLFDASGSMGEEIASVKSEFLAMINDITQKVPDLRLGIIVYGWSVYSEYPTDSPNNYVEFTDNYTQVNEFIQSLSASGGVEPWGDAFYLANTWSWRPSIPKLAIIVGDEDCDPGRIVGLGETGGYYNGSQLLNVITNLKEQGVTINSVITGTQGIVENQFKWIAEYTLGEAVYLDELLSGENPMDLPDIIEQWTVSLSREFFITLTANITWTEIDISGNQDYQRTINKEIIVDFASPSIESSYLISYASDFQIDVTATVKDLTDVSATNLYYSYDNISIIPNPTWHFTPMTLMPDGESYATTIGNLNENDPFSYYVQAIDEAGNSGTTIIYNLTIRIDAKTYGSTTRFYLPFDNSSRTIAFELTTENPKGYLMIESEQNLTIGFLGPSFTSQEVYSENFMQVFEITRTGSVELFIINITGNQGIEIEFRWVYAENYSSTSQLNDKLFTIGYTKSNILVQATLETPSEGYLSLIIESIELSAKALVFDQNWNYLGIVTAGSALALDDGTYFIWVQQVLREGNFTLYYAEEPTENTDPYYTAAAGLEFFLVVPIILAALGLIRMLSSTRRRRKHQ